MTECPERQEWGVNGERKEKTEKEVEGGDQGRTSPPSLAAPDPANHHSSGSKIRKKVDNIAKYITY